VAEIFILIGNGFLTQMKTETDPHVRIVLLSIMDSHSALTLKRPFRLTVRRPAASSSHDPIPSALPAFS